MLCLFYQVKSTVSMHKAEVGGYIRKRFPLGQVKPLKNIDEQLNMHSRFQNGFGKRLTLDFLQGFSTKMCS